MTRRLWAVLAAGLLLLLMGGCAGGGDAPDGPREVDYFGETYLVDPAAGTLSDGANTYAYSFSGDATSYQVDITYPDGSTYWFTMDAGHGSGGWSDNYDRALVAHRISGVFALVVAVLMLVL